MTAKLSELLQQGQSVWLDSIRRKSLLDGEMAELIAGGVRGETANPTIFEKALSTSDYDSEIRVLAKQGKSANEIYETLLVKDVQTACDLFRRLYDESDGADGFVSLEVSPKLALDTQGTISEVRRFWEWVSRPNLMVKIPGTKEGVPAIEQMVYEGVNVNITLLFGIEAYEAVAWAYVHALERRAAQGQPVHRIASVASFFVSRIDTLADKLLEERIKSNGDPHKFEELKSLEGRAAIANAKLAYESFQKIFGSQEFRAL
ncbi:MAG TPA: transaldolase family protein, partial [Anaerolineae bacterium]